MINRYVRTKRFNGFTKEELSFPTIMHLEKNEKSFLQKIIAHKERLE
jgi:hypothetical protein